MIFTSAIEAIHAGKYLTGFSVMASAVSQGLGTASTSSDVLPRANDDPQTRVQHRLRLNRLRLGDASGSLVTSLSPIKRNISRDCPRVLSS